MAQQPRAQPMEPPGAAAEGGPLTKQVVIRLTQDEYETLERIAREDGRSVSNLVRWVLRQFTSWDDSEPSPVVVVGDDGKMHIE